MQYIDFHTHILPEIDDGADSIAESLEMLKTARRCGAETVILTPHYHASTMDVTEFCALRDKKMEALKKAMKKDGGDFPEILSGAEVLLDGTISEKKDLMSLCVEGTDILLVELPYISWGKWHIQEVYHLVANCNLTPVIAHVERYLRKPKDVIPRLDNLVSIGAKFQINADSFLTFSGRRIIRTLAAEGLISAIGSDCHSSKDRTPDISRALLKYNKKFGDSFIDYLYHKTKQLLADSKIKKAD